MRALAVNEVHTISGGATSAEKILGTGLAGSVCGAVIGVVAMSGNAAGSLGASIANSVGSLIGFSAGGVIGMSAGLAMGATWAYLS